LNHSEEDLAQRIFSKFKHRYLELTKVPNIDEIIKALERGLGGGLDYYYKVLPRYILEKLGFRVSALMQNFLSIYAGCPHVSSRPKSDRLVRCRRKPRKGSAILALSSVDLADQSQNGEREFNKFSFLPDDQRIRAARAELKFFPMVLSQSNTVVTASRSAMDWAKELHDELGQSVKMLNETRLQDYEAITTIEEEQGKLARAFARVAKLGNSHYFFQDIVFNGSVVAHFFETSSTAIQDLHPEAKAFVELIKD
ncbi:hypothetical protein N431DRAFT_280590, partial [Stipitochalara longipes BDJ]